MPPNYNVTNVRVPVAILYASNDLLADVQVRTLRRVFQKAIISEFCRLIDISSFYSTGHRETIRRIAATRDDIQGADATVQSHRLHVRDRRASANLSTDY